MTDTAIAQVNDHITQLGHITQLLTAAQRILAGHPAHDLIEIIRAQTEVLTNDLNLLTEGV